MTTLLPLKAESKRVDINSLPFRVGMPLLAHTLNPDSEWRRKQAVGHS